VAKRSQARDAALQVLYQDELNPRVNPAVGDALLEERLSTEELLAFARELVAGVRRNREELDRRIAESAANWALDRMAVTDRCVLRLGAYEILFSDTPNTVAIDEAIELAKRFGTAQSAHFVNGVLDRLMNPAADGN
jgi:transcription antitermination protein NusB